MKTSTFERALAQNANMTPLRGESLGASIKSNPHCHCYADLKGTIKSNPHCPTHGSKTAGSPFMGYMSGTTEFVGVGGFLVVSGVAYLLKEAYMTSPKKNRFGLPIGKGSLSPDRKKQLKNISLAALGAYALGGASALV